MSDYSGIPAEVFSETVSSPSGNSDYFAAFHKPLVDRAIAKNGGKPINLLDVACGYGHELDFLKDDGYVNLYGIDLSEKVLEEARRRLPKAHLKTHDVREENLPFEPESIDAAIAVNAMGYVPQHMLRVIYASLKRRGEAVVNFYDFNNPHNQRFFDYHVEQGARIREVVQTMFGQSFTLKVLDLQTYDDEKIRKLGEQLFFNDTVDIERLIRTVGFEIIEHTPFRYQSPANQENETDVYLLIK